MPTTGEKGEFAMVATMNQTQRLLSAQIGVLPESLLVPTAFSGHEAVSTLSCFSLRFLSERPDQVQPEKIPGLPVSIALERSDGSLRYFHGHVSRFSRGESGVRFTEYQAQVVPWLWFLTLTADCRIYQDLTVPDILKQVFKDNGFFDFRSALTGEHIARDYCVQYRETDFHFVSRLMEEEGIWYYFEHTKDKHTLVFTDTLWSHPPCPGQSNVYFRPEGGAGTHEDTVNTWQVTRAVRSDRWTVRDYHFQMPEKTLECSRHSANGNGNGKPRWEVFDYPGDYALRFNKDGQRLEKVMPEGEKVARLRLEEEETPHVEVDGASTCRCFCPGFTFELRDPPPDVPKGPYLLTSVHHSATNGSVLESGGDREGSYSNTFSCLAPGATFRPDRGTEKPVVPGPQTAVVVGEKDKEVDVDKHGRVKVQFHWDRYGKKNENSSCWLRVAQVWAGKRWGASFWPRIGQEVIVSFLEGDPDQPIIIGSVYNDIQKPPYLDDGSDPKHANDPNVSGVKTCSTQGGNGFNEIRFDDSKGKEQLFLRAESAMDVRVGGDQHVSVGHQRHLIVQSDCYQDFKASKLTHVAGTEEHTIDSNQRLKVGTTREVQVLGGQKEKFQSLDTTVEKGINIRAPSRFHVDTDGTMYLGSEHFNMDTTDFLIAGKKGRLDFDELCLTCGPSSIVINTSGVWIDGPQINLNCGGAPFVVMHVPSENPPTPADPSDFDAIAADDSKTGFPSAPGAKIAPPRTKPTND
jgi:type VI secretion system secreted protein VgrG